MVNLNNNPFFKVLFSAKFSHAQVVINWNPEKRELPLELTQKIDSFWQQEIVETEKNEFIFNGELCRLNDWRFQKDKLTLDLGLSDYNELLYSNQFTNDIAQRFGKDSLARALGVSVVLVSDDEQIILIKRSKAVGENPGDLDVLGGHIHPQENAVSGVPDPFLAIKAEIKEEVHLDLKNDDPLDCIGLIEPVDTKKPELLFKAKSRLKIEEIIRLASLKQSEEVAEFLIISNQEKSLAQFLEANLNQFSPSALGVLCVYANTF